MQSVKDFLHLHHGRYEALRPRPFGMGAFHDFAAVVARLQEPGLKSSRGRYAGKPAPQLRRVEEADGRWYDEGGNTQTRVARRALKA